MADDIDDKLGRFLKFDPLAEAERLTGVSYKDKTKGDGFDNPATALGFGLMQTKRAILNAELADSDDTMLTNDYLRYTRILEEEGFKKVLSIPFVNHHHSATEPPTDELFEVWWHPRDALLLEYDTFTWSHKEKMSINGGKMYYAIEWYDPHAKDLWDAKSSGHYYDKEGTIWIGDHDNREALRFNLRRLRKFGKFLNPWPPSDRMYSDAKRWMWLVHFGDEQGPNGERKESYASWDRKAGKLFDPQTMYDYEAITDERIAMLPLEVRKSIGRA